MSAVLVVDSLKLLRLLKSVTGVRLSRRNMGLIRAVIIFGAGFYSGVYASQNYQIPPFDEPAAVAQKLAKIVTEFLEQYRKDK